MSLQINRRETATRAAKEAGQFIRGRVGQIKTIDYKSAFNIVTDVDKGAERIILDILRSAFPEDGTLAEEGGAMKVGAQRRWLIDPLDGTINFTHSYPFFCTSIAFEQDGEVELGVVYNPMSDELFWAEKGGGAWLNNEKIHVSSTFKSLSESLLATGFPPDTTNSAENNLEAFARLTSMSHGVRRDGSAALDLCFVACGRLDGFWERKLAPWDIAAGSFIVREAGGRVTDLSNHGLDLDSGHILATNGLIHNEVVSVLDQLSAKTTTSR